MTARLLICVSILGLSAWSCSTIAPPAFERIPAPEAASPVSYAHCYADHDSFYTVGGFRVDEDLSVFNSQGFRYDFKQKTWKNWSEQNGPEPKKNFATAKLGADIFVFGGAGTNRSYSRDLNVYHSDKDIWESLSVTDRLKPRLGATLTAVDEYLVVFGGKTPDHSNNWGIYNTRTRQWKVYANYDKERSSHLALAFGSKVLIWGGFENDKRTKDGYILDPSNGDLKPLAYMPFLSERSNAKALVEGEKLWIVGGMSDQGSKTDGAYYDDAYKSWKQIPPLPSADRKDFELAFIPDRGVLLWGGRDSKGAFVESAYLLELETRTWSKVALPHAPSPRIAHCLGTTDDRLYIYGGLAEMTGEALGHAKELWLIPFDDILPAE